MKDESKTAPEKFTEYVVLTVTNPSPGENAGKTRYTEVGRVSARTALDAIKAKRDGDGTYAAVPARSLKTVTVKVAQVEKVTIT